MSSGQRQDGVPSPRRINSLPDVRAESHLLTEVWWANEIVWLGGRNQPEGRTQPGWQRFVKWCFSHLFPQWLLSLLTRSESHNHMFLVLDRLWSVTFHPPGSQFFNRNMQKPNALNLQYINMFPDPDCLETLFCCQERLDHAAVEQYLNQLNQNQVGTSGW